MSPQKRTCSKRNFIQPLIFWGHAGFQRSIDIKWYEYVKCMICYFAEINWNKLIPVHHVYPVPFLNCQGFRSPQQCLFQIWFQLLKQIQRFNVLTPLGSWRWLAKKRLKPSIHRIHPWSLLSISITTFSFPLFHLLTENTPGRPDATPCRSHTHRKVNEWQTALSLTKWRLGKVKWLYDASQVCQGSILCRDYIALHAKPNGRSLVSSCLQAPRVSLVELVQNMCRIPHHSDYDFEFCMYLNLVCWDILIVRSYSLLYTALSTFKNLMRSSCFLNPIWTARSCQTSMPKHHLGYDSDTWLCDFAGLVIYYIEAVRQGVSGSKTTHQLVGSLWCLLVLRLEMTKSTLWKFSSSGTLKKS